MCLGAEYSSSESLLHLCDNLTQMVISWVYIRIWGENFGIAIISHFQLKYVIQQVLCTYFPRCINKEHKNQRKCFYLMTLYEDHGKVLSGVLHFHIPWATHFVESLFLNSQSFFSFFNWVFLMLFMIFLLLSLKQKFPFDILNIAGSLREFLWSIQNVTVHNCSCVWLRGVWTGVDVWPLWPYIMQESANREPWHPEAITPIFQF